jgi:hypothetical protein
MTDSSPHADIATGGGGPYSPFLKLLKKAGSPRPGDQAGGTWTILDASMKLLIVWCRHRGSAHLDKHGPR